MAFYQRIRDLREDADKTQSELAAYLGTTAQYYGKYEKGERLDYIAGRSNIPVNRCTISLHEDSAAVLQKYNALTERNKGKLEQFLDTLYEQQAQQKEAQSSG